MKESEAKILQDNVKRNAKNGVITPVPVSKTKGKDGIKRKQHPESDLQRACVKWFDIQYPQYRLNRMKLDNENKVSKFVGSIKREAGLLSGAADLFISVPQYGKFSGFDYVKICGLFIEFKANRSNKQTDNQIAFQEAQEISNYQYSMCYEFDEFKKIIDNYLI
jgi:hypothetical protein